MTFISGFKSLFLRQKPQNVKFCGFFVLSGAFTEHQQTNNQSIKEKKCTKDNSQTTAKSPEQASGDFY